jgi:polyisoprenoid-binding protein YceI
MSQWIIDPDHSVAAFVVRHMMIANVRGQFNKIKGKIYFEPDDIGRSSVEVVISATGIYTGIKKRDDHLRSPD